MPFEILHGALVFLGRRSGLEGAEIAAPASPWIDLPGIEPVLARPQFADHRISLLELISSINRDSCGLVPMATTCPAAQTADR
jgi:hypothetical protein